MKPMKVKVVATQYEARPENDREFNWIDTIDVGGRPHAVLTDDRDGCTFCEPLNGVQFRAADGEYVPTMRHAGLGERLLDLFGYAHMYTHVYMKKVFGGMSSFLLTCGVTYLLLDMTGII